MEALIALASQYWLHGTGVTVVGAIVAGWKCRQWWMARRRAFLDDIKKAVREEPRTKQAQNGVARDVEAMKKIQDEHGHKIESIRADVAEIKGYLRGREDHNVE